MILSQKLDIHIKDIVYIYEDKVPIPWTKKSEENKEHILLFVFNGQTKCSINGREYTYEKNDVVWRIPDSTYHANSVSVPFHYIMIGFTLHGDFDQFGFKKWDPIFRNLDKEKLIPLFQGIFKNFVNKSPQYLLDIKSELLKIISIIISSKHTHIQDKTVPFVIQPAMNYIANNFLKGTITVDELARKCFISNKHFARVFMATYQTTVKRYINTLKINYAKNLLETSRIDITKIAEQVGFSDVYYFSKIFKSIVGESPHSYRKNYQKIKLSFS